MKSPVPVRLFPLLTVSLLGLAGCMSQRPDPGAEFAAEIERTRFGIPHITAEDYKGLGYGLGYAFAQDNLCSLAREIVVANGQSALYLDETPANIERDIFYTWYNSRSRRQNLLEDQSREVQDAVAGYAAGYNRYLREAGVENLHQACAGKSWVREIDTLDLSAVYNKGNLRGGLSNFVHQIVAAQPPGAPTAQRDSRPAGVDLARINVMQGGSNAYALGADVTENGRGMLYGNPHEPWGQTAGVQRFYEFHLTLPGELDVMGVAQQGQPFVNIGFNKDVAWSHTVSTAKRFTLYQLHLDENDPMTYLYRNDAGEVERRAIRREEVTVRLPGGRTAGGTIFSSHYGPLLAAERVSDSLPPWGTEGVAFTIRDAASENPRGLVQWLALNKAESVEDMKGKLQEILGLPFVNTIAADRYGNAMYADISTVPHVTAGKLYACVNAGPWLKGLVGAGIPALDGSTAACEWGNDDDSPQAGIFGGGNLPVQVRRDYLLNSNDSYWLSNLAHPMTGFSPMLRRNLLPGVDTTVPDAHPRLLRTRMAFIQIQDRLSGADGLGGNRFTLANMKRIAYGNRSYAAEVELDAVLADCRDNPLLPTTDGKTIDAREACDVLANWDRRANLDSRGAHVFREFWARVPFRRQLATIYRMPFDEDDPLYTPGELIIDDSIRQALGDAIKLFRDAGVALDAPLGELQFVFDRSLDGMPRIPMHGGPGREGIFNVAETPNPDEDGNYAPVIKGPTYMQAVTFDEDGPIVDALLSYSQSADPARPFHRDQTRRYSAKHWIRLPFHRKEIQAQTIDRVSILE